MMEFLRTFASRVIQLLLGQWLKRAEEARKAQRTKDLLHTLKEAIRSSLGNAGLGLSTEGLIVILKNNTSVELNIRLVELTTNDGSRVVRLLHDRDSAEELPVPLHIGEERVTVSKKYSTQPQGPTREAGVLPPHTRGNWLLMFDLVDLVTFVPRRACCTVDYLGPDGERHILHTDISRDPHLANWIDIWKEKADEQKDLQERVRIAAKTAYTDGLTPPVSLIVSHLTWT